LRATHVRMHNARVRRPLTLRNRPASDPTDTTAFTRGIDSPIRWSRRQGHAESGRQGDRVEAHPEDDAVRLSVDLGGKGTLKVDGKVIESKRIPKTMPFVFPEDETFDVGIDTRTPIDDRDYQVPFRFTGKLSRLTVEEGPIRGTLAQILEFKWKTRD
jgi:hypothetical protein